MSAHILLLVSHFIMALRTNPIVYKVSWQSITLNGALFIWIWSDVKMNMSYDAPIAINNSGKVYLSKQLGDNK